MDIKTYKEKRIRSRYIIQSKLFLDVFYSLYDGVDSHQGCPVYVLKFHRDLVTPHFVDYCIQSLKDYLYQPIEGVFELMDFEFDGEDFYIFYKYQKSNFVSLELYLKTVQNQPDSSAKRYKLLLKVSRILYRLEQKQLVFANFSLNNIFVSKDEAVVLGPAKVQSLCLEYFISKVDELEGSIFLSPEFLRSFTVSTINDIYGFGILAYYMVTLHWPYTHKDSLFRLKQCFLNGPALCTDFNPKISDKLNFFIMKSIQLDPGKRWHSFRSIIGVLEGKETVKFEPLSNRLEADDAFSLDIKRQKQHRLGVMVSYVSNIGAALVVAAVVFVGYQAYFTKYETVKVPNILSMPLADVKSALETLRLHPKVHKYNFHPTIPEGHVIQLEPPVGRSIKQGRTVKLFVSKGRQEVLVPSFVGKTRKEIQFILQGMSISVEEMASEFSLEIPIGTVISQVPLPNQYMFDDGIIQLVYSKGAPAKVSVVSALDDNYQKIQVEFDFVADADSVDFEVIEKMPDGKLQELYKGVHFGGDQFRDTFIVHLNSEIVIHLNGEQILSNEVNAAD